MAGVEVGANLGADGLAQAQQGAGIVHAEAGMQLQRDLVNVMSPGEGGLFLPVGDQHFVPLVLQRLAEVIGPGAGDPVGALVAGGAAGAAGEGVDHGNTQLLGQQDGVGEVLLVAGRDGGIGMDHVAVGAQGADLQAVLVDGIQKLLALGIVSQKSLRVAVCLAGEAAAADLHHLHALGSKKRAGLVQRETTQRDSKYT